MMKNKIITVLLLAGAGFGQEAQAMAGVARKLAQGIVVATTFSGMGLSKYTYDQEKAAYDRQERKRLTPLAPEKEEKIKAFFGKHGFYPEINNTADLTGVWENGNETELALSQFDRFILTYGRLDICRGTKRAALEEKHVWAVLGHEVDHLLHHDSDKRHEMREMDWVTISSFMRKIEERSDRNAAYNLAGRDADPEILAQHAEDSAHYLKFMIPLEEQMLPQIKPFADEKKVTCEELMDHPLCSVRVAYFTELAAEFRQKKALQVEQERKIAFKVKAFAKQQREELGKFFRGEVKK